MRIGKYVMACYINKTRNVILIMHWFVTELINRNRHSTEEKEIRSPIKLMQLINQWEDRASNSNYNLINTCLGLFNK